MILAAGSFKAWPHSARQGTGMDPVLRLPKWKNLWHPPGPVGGVFDLLPATRAPPPAGWPKVSRGTIQLNRMASVIVAQGLHATSRPVLLAQHLHPHRSAEDRRACADDAKEVDDQIEPTDPGPGRLVCPKAFLDQCRNQIPALQELGELDTLRITLLDAGLAHDTADPRPRVVQSSPNPEHGW